MSETVTEEAHGFKNLITIKVKDRQDRRDGQRHGIREGPQPDRIGR